MSAITLTDDAISSGECLAMVGYHIGEIRGISLAKWSSAHASTTVERVERIRFHLNEATALLERAVEKFEAAVADP